MTSPAEQFAALKAIAGGAALAEAVTKGDALAVFHQTGADRWRTPHGTVIIKNASAGPTAVIGDDAAFTEWVRENHPDEIETVTYERVRPAFRDVMGKRLKVYPAAEGREPMVVDGKTGEVAPWARLQPPPPPQVSMVGGTDAAAQEAKLAAARVFLDAIDAGRPVLEAGDQS